MIEGKFGACPAVPHPRERDSGTTPPTAGQSLGQQRDTIPAGPCCTARFEESEAGRVAVSEEGARVNGYKTSIRAARLLSIALGGDSHIRSRGRQNDQTGHLPWHPVGSPQRRRD